MTDITAQIAAKGCNKTGITDDLAQEMFNNVGKHYMAIVELQVVRPHGPDIKGKRQIELVITSIEPVVDGNLNGQVSDTVRNIQRALWRNRGEEPIDGVDGDEPTVAEVKAAADALVEVGEDGEVTGLWDGKQAEEDDKELQHT